MKVYIYDNQKLANPWYWNIKLAVNSSGPITENAGKISAKNLPNNKTTVDYQTLKRKIFAKKTFLK